MRNKEKSLGVAFTCSLNGKVLNVVSDSCGLFGDNGEDKLFTAVVGTQSVEKTLNFLQYIKEHNAAHNREFFF